MIDMYMEIQKLPEKEQQAKMVEIQKKVDSGYFGAERLFIGTINDVPQVSLKDKTGKTRLKLFLDENDEPQILTYDEKGNESKKIIK